MLEDLKKQVCDANLELVDRGVVIYTWGGATSVVLIETRDLSSSNLLGFLTSNGS